MRAVIESPLAGDFQRNFRFALWCARALWKTGRVQAIASHMINPWFMDDKRPAEREAGIDNEWVWGRDVRHYFFLDLGESRGMALARKRCAHDGIPASDLCLEEYDPACWAAFQRGEWPPHTPGFEVKS